LTATAPNPSSRSRALLSGLARVPLTLDATQYDLQDSCGTIRSVPRRWRWITEGLDEIPGAALVALEAMADVLVSAGGMGQDLDSLADGVETELAALSAEHGARSKLCEVLGENHPLLIATEECDRLLSAAGRVVASEIGQPQQGVVAHLHSSDGGVPKSPCATAELGTRGLVGDRQATRAHHGRPFQAVCIYSSEVIAELAAQGHPISPGSVGENLTLGGIDWSRIRPGIRMAVGPGESPVVLEVSSFAPPCRSIAGSFLERRFDRIDHDRYPGVARAYAWVVRPGTVTADDPVTVLP